MKQFKKFSITLLVLLCVLLSIGVKPSNAAVYTDYSNGNYTYVSSVATHGYWKQVGTQWEFIKPNGKVTTGWAKIDDSWYLFDTQGYMKIGWVYTGGNWYYLKSSGAMATGWLKTDNCWYYLKSNGAMAKDWIKDGNSWYYLNASGVMQTGWVRVNSNYYFLKSNGAMATGWIKVGKYWYYCYSDGHKLCPSKNGEVFNIASEYHQFNIGGTWVKKVASQTSVTSSAVTKSPSITAHGFTIGKGQGYDTDRFEASAMDPYGNDISEQIEYLGIVDTNMVGTYRIILQVTSKDGITAQKACTVTVQA